MKKKWINYYLDIAHVVAKGSKDPSSQVGAVIVDGDGSPVSFGFNGFIKGCDENCMTFERPMKYNLIIHAEMNALMFAKRDLKDCVMLITHGPCENCLKHVLQSGIREIYYDDCSIVRDRASDESKEAISLLIESVNAKVLSRDRVCYLEEIKVNKDSIKQDETRSKK